MRTKLGVMAAGVFVATAMAASVSAQHARGRGRARTAPVAATAAVAVDEPPTTDRIEGMLNSIPWGQTHEQVMSYFRQAINERVTPLLRNKGMVEQDRIIQDREREIEAVNQSYVVFDGSPANRRWDTSLIGNEFAHNDGESMLVHEDPRTHDREFFFFVNDHLWKRYQVKNPPPRETIDFAAFLAQAEGAFGHGRRHGSPGAPERVVSVDWQDANTHLRIIDSSTFYNAVSVVFEERATMARMAELHHAAEPTKVMTSAGAGAGDPQLGNAAEDSNADIVDRLTGHASASASVHASDAGAAAAGAHAGTNATTGTNARGGDAGAARGGRTPAAPSTAPARADDEIMRGL